MTKATEAREHDTAGTNARAGGRARPPASGQAGTMSMLSVFLLLLAFFIMLNTLSTFEQTKTRAVLDSLNSTFNVARPSGPERALSSFFGHLQAVDLVERTATNRLRTMIGMDRFELIRAGSVVAVDVDVRPLFYDGAVPTPALGALAEDVTRALASAPVPFPLAVTATSRVPLGPVGAADPDDVDLAARRAGAVVRAFERVGLAPGAMLAGIATGDPGRVRIEFRIGDDGEANSGRMP